VPSGVISIFFKQLNVFCPERVFDLLDRDGVGFSFLLGVEG